MVTFSSIIQKFANKGEKTGWTYIDVPAHIANEIKPNTKTSFRVKGKLDEFTIRQTALVPMGEGDFILPLNSEIRKGIRKKEGATIQVMIEPDESQIELSADLLECLEDEPKALAYFKKLSKGHQNYFSNWIESAKTPETKSNRIVKAIKGLSMEMGYGPMIRYFKDIKNTE